MDKVSSNFNFTTIERIMQFMEDDHSDTTLIKLKNELNKFFINTKCKQAIYTLNTDKLFFGMRVYPILDGILYVPDFNTFLSYVTTFVVFPPVNKPLFELNVII